VTLIYSIVVFQKELPAFKDLELKMF